MSLLSSEVTLESMWSWCQLQTLLISKRPVVLGIFSIWLIYRYLEAERTEGQAPNDEYEAYSVWFNIKFTEKPRGGTLSSTCCLPLGKPSATRSHLFHWHICIAQCRYLTVVFKMPIKIMDFIMAFSYIFCLN